jgi:hypothetical protein
VRHVGREGVGVGMKSSQTSVTARYIRWLTDEYPTTLSSSVQTTFLGAGIEECSPVIFLGAEKYIHR